MFILFEYTVLNATLSLYRLMRVGHKLPCARDSLQDSDDDRPCDVSLGNYRHEANVRTRCLFPLAGWIIYDFDQESYGKTVLMAA